MKKTILFFFVGFSLISYAQDQKTTNCSTTGSTKWLEEHPELAVERALLESFTAEFAQNNDEINRTQITIPIVFHINDPTNPQKVTAAQIQSAITILNEDFNAQNPGFTNLRPEFAGIASNVGITFCLATKDPNGNATTGITYHYNNYDGREPDGTGSAVKDVSYWPSHKYLNAWVVNEPEGGDQYTSGWAYLPSSWAQQNQVDGIIYNHRYLGYTGSSEVSGPSSWQQEMAHVLTHEIGHFLNLDHTFENYCSSPGDQVSDTPPVYYHGSNNCEQLGEKCQGVTLVNDENYMDYTPCPSMYTAGQKTRMLAALNSSVAARNNLWSTSNLIATGCSQSTNGLDEFGTVIPPIIFAQPNPFEDEITVTISAPAGFYSLQLTNLIGEMIVRDDMEIGTDFYSTKLDLNTVPAGVYLIQISNGTHSSVERIIKY